ncbi:uncharacterized protein LOC134819617 isoform X2 [Bolinopsis microptera]|uniref:uncharacterized protein LOC134819617 isoform X2 n=1 Tax=Bolinopsis microptera TaxID=2820187 RepID=UPI003079E0A6
MGEDESVYRQIVHPLAQQTLKNECTKLTDFTKIIHDFLNSLSSIYDTAGTSIVKLVEENKKKIAEVTRENLQYPNTTLTAWLGLLENFKEEGTLHSKFAGDIKNETVVTLQEQRNHVKESVKRIYGFRDGISASSVREAEQRDKGQKDYSGLWGKYKAQLNSGTTKKGSIMPTYTAYNSYLLQLTYSNGMNKSALDVQLPNLMQELEAVEHNLHNFLVSVLSYTFSRQDHHFNECRDIVSNSSNTIQNIDPALDVAKLGESLVLPPEVHPIYLDKEFIPADTEDSGIPKDISNGYLAKEEYTAHTLSKKYKRTKKDLSNLDVEVKKRNKDLDALSKLLSTYQENPTYGKASDIEVQMSTLRNELRMLEMSRFGLSSQLRLLEESGVVNSGSLSDDEDNKSINSIIEQGEHEWVQLSMTEMKSCDHCQKPTMLQRVYQCNKCKVNVHNGCRTKVFDCVGQPLVEQTADKVSKIRDTIMKGAGGIFSRGHPNKKGGQEECSVNDKGSDSDIYECIDVDTPDSGISDGRDQTLSAEWWTLQKGAQAPNLADFASDDDDVEDVYDNIEEINKESIPSDESEEEEEIKAPMIIRQSDQHQRRPPLAPPKPPEIVRPDFPPEEVNLLVQNPIVEGSLYVCVALYEYKDLEHSSEAWCAPGFRVDVVEETNEDWHKGVCNGQTGYFPSNYLEKIPERGAVLRCLYDYQAQRPDELTISAGQVIFRLEDQNNGWIYGRIRTNRGLFPASYVEELVDFK